MRPCVNAMSLASLLAIVSPAIGGPRAEALARCKAIQDGIERRDCFQSLNGKKKRAPSAPLVEDPRAGDDPATTSTVDHPSGAGQPSCADRDALAAMLVAGMLTSSAEDVTTNGCQTIPENAQVQVLESYPTVFHFLRTVKVQITAPSLPEPKIGYTIEIGR